MPDAVKGGLRRDTHGRIIQSLRPHPDNVENVSFTATSAQSSAFKEDTVLIRLEADQRCRYKLGSSPTADSSSTPLPAGVIEFPGVNPGEKLAVIRTTADGTLHITEMNG